MSRDPEGAGVAPRSLQWVLTSSPHPHSAGSRPRSQLTVAPEDTGTQKPLLRLISLEPKKHRGRPNGLTAQVCSTEHRELEPKREMKVRGPGPGALRPPAPCPAALQGETLSADPARKDANWGLAGRQPSWSPEKQRRGQDRHLLQASPSPRVPGKSCGTPPLQDWRPCPTGITPKDPCDSDRLSYLTNSLPWELARPIPDLHKHTRPGCYPSSWRSPLPAGSKEIKRNHVHFLKAPA